MQAPTERQIEVIRKIAQEREIPFPDDIVTDFNKCRSWIYEQANLRKPTEKQFEMAENLTLKLGNIPTVDELKSSKKLGKWIAKQLKIKKQTREHFTGVNIYVPKHD